ncbi:MAG: NAD(+) synthase [Lachnospiraceae bacterium]|nr:NAD(+) synthase [Lachnospiraceae bacterium]
MRDYKKETEERIEYIRNLLESSHTKGIIYGNSGGKDSALVGILCKMACDNTVGIIMPCASKRNFGEDMKDGLDVAEQFGIETRTVDLTSVREEIVKQISPVAEISSAALSNIAPRLRMTTLYAIGQSEGRLVAGTGNRDELYVGYYTKYGDGGSDFNPIADLTVSEVYEFLEYLGAPENIIKKAPSAGLFEGQTDEGEMGIKYSQIDEYLMTGKTDPEAQAKIERMHKNSEHKRIGVQMYKRII